MLLLSSLFCAGSPVSRRVSVAVFAARVKVVAVAASPNNAV